jgi:NAD(P)-dependent dehydrogenase (short-subunit alcohol dehydrogenase family)
VSFVLDVTEPDKCREVAAQIAAQVGQVSILINNAGINRRNAATPSPRILRPIFSIFSHGWRVSRASLRSPIFKIRVGTKETQFEVDRDWFDGS